MHCGPNRVLMRVQVAEKMVHLGKPSLIQKLKRVANRCFCILRPQNTSDTLVAGSHWQDGGSSTAFDNLFSQVKSNKNSLDIVKDEWSNYKKQNHIMWQYNVAVMKSQKQFENSKVLMEASNIDFTRITAQRLTIGYFMALPSAYIWSTITSNIGISSFIDYVLTFLLTWGCIQYNIAPICRRINKNEEVGTYYADFPFKMDRLMTFNGKQLRLLHDERMVPFYKRRKWRKWETYFKPNNFIIKGQKAYIPKHSFPNFRHYNELVIHSIRHK